jgi:hypothetical protein
MNTIQADFNAMNEEERVWLDTIAARRSIEQAGIRPGDWAWLTDGELFVGAQVVEEAPGRLLGVPAWETLVYLEDEEGRDFGQVFAELEGLLATDPASRADQRRLLQLVTWFDLLAPSVVRKNGPATPLSGAARS